MIEITVKANHFKGAEFCNNRKCAIANAAQSRFPGSVIIEGVNYLHIDKQMYLHDEYNREMFEQDMETAKEFGYSPIAVIRTIKLERYDTGNLATSEITPSYLNADLV